MIRIIYFWIPFIFIIEKEKTEKIGSNYYVLSDIEYQFIIFNILQLLLMLIDKDRLEYNS